MNPYLIGGVALVIVVMGWQLKVAVTRNGELAAKIEMQAAETLECAAANETNLTTVTTLEVRLSEMIAERAVDATEREKILDERDQELAIARAEARKLRDEIRDDFTESPDCTDLASLRVDFFCPLNSDRLRERSISQGSN